MYAPKLATFHLEGTKEPSTAQTIVSEELMYLHLFTAASEFYIIILHFIFTNKLTILHEKLNFLFIAMLCLQFLWYKCISEMVNLHLVL